MSASQVRRPIPADVEALDAIGILQTSFEAIGRDRLAIASSFGAEDVVLIDLLASLEPRPRVFTLDTGRLPQETYDLMDQVRRRYGIDVEVYFPERRRVEAMVRAKGLNLFYESTENRIAVLPRPQGRAARARARDGRRLGHGPSPRPDRDPCRDAEDRARSSSTAGSGRSLRSPTGAATGSGRTSASTTCRTTRSTIAATRRSAARRAPGRSSPARTSAPGAGGGSGRRSASAGSTSTRAPGGWSGLAPAAGPPARSTANRASGDSGDGGARRS